MSQAPWVRASTPPTSQTSYFFWSAAMLQASSLVARRVGVSHGLLRFGAQRAFRPVKQADLRQDDLKKNGSKQDVSTPSTPRFATARLMANYMWPADWSSRACVVATALSIGSGKYLGLSAPQIYGDLVNRITKVVAGKESDSEDVRSLYWLLTKYVACKLGSHALHEFKSGVFTPVQQKAMRRAAVDAFKALQEADLDAVIGSRSGELINQLDRGSKAVGTMMSNVLMRLIPMTIELTMLTKRVQKHHKAGKLNWVTWSTLGSYFAFTFLYSNLRVRYRLRGGEAETMLRGVTQESLLNSELTRLLGTSEFERQKFADTFELVYDSRHRINTSLSLLNFGQQAILNMGTFIAMLTTLEKIFMREVPVGDLIAVSHLLQQIAHPLHFLGTMYRELRTSYAEIGTLHEIMRLKKSIVDAPRAKPLLINRGTVEFSDVTFKYPRQDHDCITDLSLKIHGGTRVGIVGPSGSGKSTLVKLLSRLYDVDAGSVSICVQDIRNVTLDSLRGQLGIVPQDVVLFNDTIRNNILYGNWEASEDELKEAVEAAALDDVVAKFPQGLDTIVGERGSRLSGGERQRVALARCLLKRPRILILDEATSNLDAKSEARIMETIKSLSRGRTVVVIAHRLRAIADTDQIFFMSDGRIAERGSHDELLARGGLYAEMWNKQQLMPEDDATESTFEDAFTSTNGSPCSTGSCTH
eukprot:Blabericola_migrator_1__875@NODE_1214_length_5099_cov_173_435612_g824_i0_p1_GENE_NODE_1214_length_5099_cov_173_435612_g824_i0NODE_1214_length_5099_cov_173_435612_g824_i0_p1_ORF_typecomplete_len699_score106_94ABC_tran/PF00005_27/1_5e03ABC_tran/PF00005_27/5_2e42ABC_membrane/PF00664_23/1_8e19SMC_N/PF02463_19/5_9SMC_N/PF02463_19/5_5e08AAA_21/PF13304_6/8_6e02AAA_21/PF13304_6/4_9e08AAA_18/PF13238_6/3_9e06TniB/PF05621_11/0_12TniB/PF05621_11/0_28AAA_22/PF13401_6/0_00016AAA_33/PF13671_6/0_00038AAA/PF0000